MQLSKPLLGKGGAGKWEALNGLFIVRVQRVARLPRGCSATFAAHLPALERPCWLSCEATSKYTRCLHRALVGKANGSPATAGQQNQCCACRTVIEQLRALKARNTQGE